MLCNGGVYIVVGTTGVGHLGRRLGESCGSGCELLLTHRYFGRGRDWRSESIGRVGRGLGWYVMVGSTF